MADVCLVTKTWRSGAAWVAQMTAQSIAENDVLISYVAPLAEPVGREPAHSNLIRIVLDREIVDGGGGALRRAFASLKRVLSGWSAVLGERLRTRTFIFAIPDPLIFTIPLFMLLRLSGARIVFLVHDVVPHAWRLPASMRRIELGAHLLSYRLATELVVMTSALRDQLVGKFGFPAEKVSVIPHGPFELRPVTDSPGNGQLFAFGTFRRNKNILEIIRGVSLARRTDSGVRLLLAGEPHPNEPGYWDACLEEMAKDAAGFTIRPGFLPDEVLPDLIDQIDAFILAYMDFSSQSGVGIIAAFAGRPVIGTKVGGLGELFAAGLSGTAIVEPVTAQGVADAIALFRSEPIETWRARAAQGKASIASTMSWRAIGRSYAELIGKTGGSERRAASVHQ